MALLNIMILYYCTHKGTHYNKANQHQSLRSLDSLAVASFLHGCAIITQNNQQQVCRCLRR